MSHHLSFSYTSTIPSMKLKRLNVFIRKWKSLSSRLKGANSCYSSSSNKEEQRGETVYVGSSRRRYVIGTKHLRHPLINALIEKPSQEEEEKENGNEHEHERSADGTGREVLVSIIKCEVVLFDHLLWMIENADPNSLSHPDQSLEDLADLYKL